MKFGPLQPLTIHFSVWPLIRPLAAASRSLLSTRYGRTSRQTDEKTEKKKIKRIWNGYFCFLIDQTDQPKSTNSYSDPIRSHSRDSILHKLKWQPYATSRQLHNAWTPHHLLNKSILVASLGRGAQWLSFSFLSPLWNCFHLSPSLSTSLFLSRPLFHPPDHLPPSYHDPSELPYESFKVAPVIHS